MSQEAEYYVRNLTYGEARDLARRIAGQERAAAERHAQQLFDRESRRVEGRMRGEIAGLRQEVERRQGHLQQQLDCNRRLSEALNAKVNAQGKTLEEHGNALQVLAEHDRELQRQIEENNRFTTELAARQAATERQLAQEIAARRAERENHARSVSDQRRLATSLIDGLPVSRLQAAGLSPDFLGLRSSLDRGLLAAGQSGNEQTALALLIEVQNKADGLLLELDRRESEIALRRERTRLALDAARSRLGQLREDRDVATVFAKPLAGIDMRLSATSAASDSLQKESGLEFTRVLARWDVAVGDSRALQEELENLWNDRDRVLDQVRQRNRIVQAMIKSLMDVWGANFELDHMYAATDDPRSTLMLQTKRPHGRNVTMHVDLDGRMQVSFTGYVGMECAADLAEFQSKLEKVGDLKVEREALRDPLVFRPAANPETRQTEVRKR
jgi:hypothetical protein